MPRALSPFFREQVARYDALKKKSLTTQEKNEILTLPRPINKTGKIRGFIDSLGFVGKENLWAKNPRTGNLVPISHKKLISQIGMSVSSRTLASFAKKYNMLVHVHPSGNRTRLLAAPSLEDIETFMKSGFNSSAIIILDSNGKSVGSIMVRKTNAFLNGSNNEKKNFRRALNRRLNEILYWDINKNIGSYAYRKQLALNKLLSEGKLGQYGFRMRITTDKKYKQTKDQNQYTIIEKE